MVAGLVTPDPLIVPRLLTLFLSLALLAPAAAEAIHANTPAILQVTPANPGTIGTARWGGLRYVVFDSDADIAGTGNATRQLFLFDLRERVLFGAPGVTQLTSGADDPRRASLDKRGRWVVYDARPGGVGPRQLFALDRKKGVSFALTQGAADSTTPRIDERGRSVTFESAADLLGAGVPGPQVYLLDLRRADPACPYPCAATANHGLTQITAAASPSRGALAVKNGGQIVLESDADLAASGETETQIYRLDLKKGTTVALTHGPGASRGPAATKNGASVALESDADLAGNATGGTQIYVHGRKSPPPAQITFAPGGSSLTPSLSSNGRSLIFVSADDLLGTGSSGPEIYLYDTRRRTLTQMTDIGGSIAAVDQSAGVFFLFLATGDVLGNGATGTQLYVVNPFTAAGQTVP